MFSFDLNENAYKLEEFMQSSDYDFSQIKNEELIGKLDFNIFLYGLHEKYNIIYSIL